MFSTEPKDDPKDSIRLLSRWGATLRGDSVRLPMRAQRLVAYVALDEVSRREQVAAELWPDTTDARALTNLRAALADVRRSAAGLIEVTEHRITVATTVDVDVHNLLHDPDSAAADADPASTAHSYLSLGDLLPGWYDPWLTRHRERIVALKVEVLDGLVGRLLDEGQPYLALRVAMEATRLEPLRESGYRALVRVHLASGNELMAFQVYRSFRTLSVKEFGIAPTVLFDDLVSPLLTQRRLRRVSPEATAGELPPIIAG